MPRRPGGLDPTEINEALTALNSTTTAEAVEEVLDRIPALSSPFLHAILRQQYLELHNSKSPYLAGFEARYRYMFLLLHERWHESLIKQCQADYARIGQTNIEPITKEPYGPPFWTALLHALDGATPPETGPFYDPATDSEALNAELSKCLGRAITLPPFTPTRGSKWSAVLVGCGACNHRRVDVRAYVADLVLAPELSGPLREQRINTSRCPACGATLSYPVRVWVMESPGPGDTLATLSCVWRLSPVVFNYQPPPGTPRVEENDRILEIRFEKLIRAVSWPNPEGQPVGDGPVQTTMSISYTPAELIRYLDRTTVHSDEIPFAMETMIREMTRKVESGVLPLHQGMDAVLQHATMFGAEWPILNPGRPRLFKGPPVAHLFQCLAAEGVLRAQSATPDARAFFASFTATSLMALGEGALAEAALARAEDSLALVEPGRARDLATSAVADARADLLEFLERYDEAAVIRQQLLTTTPELQTDDLQARMARAGLSSQLALGFYKEGHFGKALEALRECIANWQALIEEIAADETETATMQSRVATHALSGDYANLAALLTSIAEDLVVTQIVSMPGLSDEERLALMIRSHQDPLGAIARANDAFTELESLFGDDITRGRLITEAHNLLRQALFLSDQVEGWEFAGIQAHRLAILHYGEDDNDVAADYAERAIGYAARAGDHERIYSSLALLADLAMKQNDGATAITHLEAAARERIRHDVGLGHHTELEQTAEALGNAAFEAIKIGGEPLRAVMIVESLRAANMAASIVTGTPMQPGGGQQLEALTNLNLEREKLRLHLIWSPSDEEAQTRLATVETALDQERERVSLRDPRYSRWVDATDVDIAAPKSLIRRLAQLGPNTFWLGVLAVGNQVWSYSADANGALVQSAPLPSFPKSNDATGDDPAGDAWTVPVLEQFAQAILAPHAARIEALEPDDIIVISVAGALHQIPFAALSWAGKPLCEWATLLMVQGFGMLEAALDRQRPALNSFALIGAPTRQDLDPLPGAAAEINMISALLTAAGRDVKVVQGPKAMVAALTEAAANHDVVHIACHAVADPLPEHASKLMLSPDLRRGDSGELSEDRIVSAVEVRQGAVINLSGCATGRTHQSSAPLLGGLVPAFLLAGAGSVIASLWPIADDPAAKFQAELYRQLLTGARPAAALARAQRRCARGELGADTQEISVWAAHVGYGAG